MIYVYRTLWAIGYIPVYICVLIAFLIGAITYPIVDVIDYIIHGATHNMKWDIGTMAFYIAEKYSKLKDLIEKQR